MNAEIQKHVMVLDKVHDSGAEEWYCPTCGRRFLMQWPPQYKKIVLDEGDASAIHSGGNTQVDGLPAEMEADAENIDVDAASLSPYEDWMDHIDFNRLWGD